MTFFATMFEAPAGPWAVAVEPASNTHKNGQGFDFFALRYAQNGQKSAKFWASNTQNRGQQMAEASRGLPTVDSRILTRRQLGMKS
jgi:hypothetical protein